jgi:hypothetical protein
MAGPDRLFVTNLEGEHHPDSLSPNGREAMTPDKEKERSDW